MEMQQEGDKHQDSISTKPKQHHTQSAPDSNSTKLKQHQSQTAPISNSSKLKQHQSQTAPISNSSKLKQHQSQTAPISNSTKLKQHQSQTAANSNSPSVSNRTKLKQHQTQTALDSNSTKLKQHLPLILHHPVNSTTRDQEERTHPLPWRWLCRKSLEPPGIPRCSCRPRQRCTGSCRWAEGVRCWRPAAPWSCWGESAQHTLQLKAYGLAWSSWHRRLTLRDSSRRTDRMPTAWRNTYPWIISIANLKCVCVCVCVCA